MSETHALLRALLSMTARQTFQVDRLVEIVTKGGGKKQIEAFNLCDGSRSQGEVAAAVKLDTGNFSKTVGRWVEAGILFKFGEGRDTKLLHAYPIPAEFVKKARN